MKLYPTSAIIIALLATSSCSNDDNNTPLTPTIVKEWTVAMAAVNENPAPAGRTETGTATMKLYSDNSFSYTVTVDNLAATDGLANAHLHAGDVITSGGVILPFAPTFNGNTASDTLTGLRQSLVDSLKDDANDIYVNVHSTQVGSGLVRGQLNKTIDWAMDVAMTGANEVPPVTTAATGLASFRLAIDKNSSDKNLYTKITVQGLEAADAWSAAHIHPGAAGANGGVYLGIYNSAAEFGSTKIFPASDAMIDSLKNDALYVNAHTTLHPGGAIRGQIR